jgi:hypothetical protein
MNLRDNELIEFLDTVEEMAANGFSPEEIAEVTESDKEKFIKSFRDPESILYKRYRKGFLQASLKLRQRIFLDAGHGSSPAQTLAKKILDDAEYKLNNL